MRASSWLAIQVVATAVGLSAPERVWAQASGFAGRWTLNRELSEFPREIGFDASWFSTGSGEDTAASGGRGRRGSTGGGTGPFTARESEDDAKLVRGLTAEVRDPSAHVTIVETPGAVTFTDDREQTRTFHPNAREEVLRVDGVPVSVIAKREGGRLIVVYKVPQGRELRYTFSRVADPSQLIVDVQLVEHGGGDRIRRIYEPSSASETRSAEASRSETDPRSAEASRSEAAQTFNQQPDAELKGLTKLGVVVEGLGPQAAGCGLNQGTLETAIAKRLSDAGFKVLRNSDEDTYVYVNVMTSSVSSGLCVSRYDVFLYTHTTARLSYQETPVLVQVSLLHKGGLAGGAPAAHPDAVLRGLQEYVDQFSTRIRDANK